MNEQIISKFAKDLASIKEWFQTERELDELISVHKDLNSLGKEYRNLFKHKGDYKTVKRVFIKYCACYLSTRPKLWPYLESSLMEDIFVKSIQGWIPFEKKRNRYKQKDTLSYSFWSFLFEKYMYSKNWSDFHKYSPTLKGYIKKYLIEKGYMLPMMK